VAVGTGPGIAGLVGRRGAAYDVNVKVNGGWVGRLGSGAAARGTCARRAGDANYPRSGRESRRNPGSFADHAGSLTGLPSRC
jgi:hypothetical protein